MAKIYLANSMTETQFREFIQKAVADGYGTAMVPVTEGDEIFLDKALDDGVITDYAVWVEVSLKREQDQ